MKTNYYFAFYLTFILNSFFAFGQNNAAFDFDDVNDYVSVPNASSLISTNPAMSMSCWVYPTNPAASYPNFDGFMGFRNDFNADFYLLQLSSTQVEARFRNSAGTNFDVVQTGLVLNTWQHFALTYDGSTLRVYLNGVLGGSTPANGNITNSAVEFVMGKLDFSATDFFLNGGLDEVGLWSKALSAAEVACIYNRGILPTDPDLQLYFDFNDGIAGGNNTGLTTVTDRKGNINGQIINAALTGTSSNYVAGVASHTQLIAQICAGGSFPLGSQTLTTPGVYYDVIPVASSCDSIVALTLLVEDTVYGTDTRSECSPYVWIDGNTYTANNTTAQHTLVGMAATGCDSTVTLNLTIIGAANGTDLQTACETFTWINGITYTASNNTAQDTIVGGAASGCDSIISLDLTILNPISGTTLIIACETFTWIDGVTYTSNNNTATFTLVGGAANGCDSITSLDLTILEPALGTDVQTACDAFTWIDGTTYTTSNNTASFTIIGGAANTCDSIVKLDLTISSIDTVVTLNNLTLTSATAGANYQWLDCGNNLSPIAGATNASFTAQSNGSYAVAIELNSCVDTSSCVEVIIESILDNSFESTIHYYPNPTQGQLNIDMGQNYQGLQVEVYTMLGQLVSKQSFDNVQLVPVDLEQQVAGIYFVHLFDNMHRSAQHRVVKE